MADQRDPDLTDDPRGNDVGQGYPEAGQAGSGGDAIDQGEYPDKSERGGTPDSDGPSGSKDADGDAGQTTGNERNAG